jgi:dTDP-D-glucose 4,6-dehydratase
VQAFRSEDLTVYGDNTQTRSFQYIHDLVRLVDGLVALMNSSEVPPVSIGNADDADKWSSESVQVKNFIFDSVLEEEEMSVELVVLLPTSTPVPSELSSLNGSCVPSMTPVSNNR